MRQRAASHGLIYLSIALEDLVAGRLGLEHRVIEQARQFGAVHGVLPFKCPAKCASSAAAVGNSGTVSGMLR